ncbi:MAG: MAPEG family protein [Pseudomonadales bacterium]|nr:MAPEG family protein [Pseudomonadales bacterium]
MSFLNSYTAAYWGIFFSLLTLVVQQFVAAGSKGSQEGAIPGKIDESLSHSSFVFRAHRTFLNSLENFPAMLGTSFLAIFVGVNPTWAGLLIWVFAIARMAHMFLYYTISTENNPSPRSYFFLIGVVANIVLLVFCGVALF